MNVPVKCVEALLSVAVHVVGQGVAGLLDRLEEGTEQRTGRGATLKDQRAVAAAPVVLPCQAGLHAPEVGKAVCIVPGLTARGSRPAVVVHRVPPLEDHPVDARGTTENPAAGVVDPAATHLWFRLRLVLPVVEPVANAEREGSRHVDEHIPPVVGTTGLDHQHPVRGVGTETAGQGTAGRTPADDYKIVVVRCLATHLRTSLEQPSRTRRVCPIPQIERCNPLQVRRLPRRSPLSRLPDP